jgi:hypothetical protein
MVTRVRIVQWPMGHGFMPDDAEFIMAVLRHPLGWARRGHTFERVWSATTGHDVVIFLRPPSYMDGRFAAAERLRGLSVTETTPGGPSTIHIHEANWDTPPGGFDGSRGVYRAYLIQHEIGHCLGHGHEPAPPPPGQRPAPAAAVPRHVSADPRHARKVRAELSSPRRRGEVGHRTRDAQEPAS